MRLSITFGLLGLFASAEEDCYLPIDVMFLQDTTGSFVDDLPNVVRQIPDMVAAILEQNPNSYFGVAEFKDKPYYPLGESDDFCYKLGDGLQEDVDKFKQAYSLLYASGGGDLPEAQFQALIDISLDPNVKWRPIQTGSRNAADTGAHLVIMSTDAIPHLPGQLPGLHVLYPSVPNGLPTNPGTINPPSLAEVCADYDYPSDVQMKAALDAQNIYLAILTPNDPTIVPTWKWVNEDLLTQPSDFYQFIAADSSDLIDGVLKAIKAVTEYACTTTTPEPTMAPSTTTTTTTTTTTPSSTTTTMPPTTTTTTMPPTTTTTTSSTTTTTMPPTTTTSPMDSTASAECPPCPPCEMPEECPPCHPCANTAAVVIKVDHRPGKLEVYYEK